MHVTALHVFQFLFDLLQFLSCVLQISISRVNFELNFILEFLDFIALLQCGIGLFEYKNQVALDFFEFFFLKIFRLAQFCDLYFQLVFALDELLQDNFIVCKLLGSCFVRFIQILLLLSTNFCIHLLFLLQFGLGSCDFFLQRLYLNLVVAARFQFCLYLLFRFVDLFTQGFELLFT